jgi:hypothetical protein
MFNKKPTPNHDESARRIRQAAIDAHNAPRAVPTRSQAIDLMGHYLSEMLIRTRKYVTEEANVDAIIAEYKAKVGTEYKNARLAAVAMKQDQRFTDGVADADWYRRGAELMANLHNTLAVHVQELDRRQDRRNP